MSSYLSRNNNDVELGSMARIAPFEYRRDEEFGPGSLRSSLEDNFDFQSQDCSVFIHDDLPARRDDALNELSTKKPLQLPAELRTCLNVSRFVSYRCCNGS